MLGNLFFYSGYIVHELVKRMFDKGLVCEFEFLIGWIFSQSDFEFEFDWVKKVISQLHV